MIEEIKIEEIKERSNNRTPGEWVEAKSICSFVVEGGKNSYWDDRFLNVIGCKESLEGEVVENPIVLTESGTMTIGAFTTEEWVANKNDATFIAHAPTDIEYLLAEVERLRGLLVEIGEHADKTLAKYSDKNPEEAQNE